MLKMKIIFLMMLLSTAANAAVWVSSNSWSNEWESKYSAWISNDVKNDFFKKNNIKTDCADAVISLRWIFSRINSLPMASNMSSGKLITNLTPAWDQFAVHSEWNKDQRFLKALNDINDMTSTATLMKDVYPVKINSENLKPGTLYVNSSADAGHAEWITKMNYDNMNIPITFSSSTVPAVVRETLAYPFMKPKWPLLGTNGFFRFRQAELSGNIVILKSKESMEGYSLEQYQLSDQYSSATDFDDFVTERLIGHPLNGLRKLQTLSHFLVQRLESRVAVVEEGFKACSLNLCKAGTDLFYSHSTYARDGAIQFLIIGITELIYSDKNIQNVDDQMAGQMVLWWSQSQSENLIRISGLDYPMGLLVSKWNEKLISSDPNTSIQKRWGL